MKGENESLHMRELQERIGFNGDKRGRSLLAELFRREEMAGKEFVTRHPGAKKTRHKCTVAMVREFAPDLVRGQRDTLLAEAREALNKIEARALAAARSQVEKLRPDVENLQKSHAEMADIVNSLATRVNVIDERTTPSPTG